MSITSGSHGNWTREDFVQAATDSFLLKVTALGIIKTKTIIILMIIMIIIIIR